MRSGTPESAPPAGRSRHEHDGPEGVRTAGAAGAWRTIIDQVTPVWPATPGPYMASNSRYSDRCVAIPISAN
jgi:hypothetical protein